VGSSSAPLTNQLLQEFEQPDVHMCLVRAVNPSGLLLGAGPQTFTAGQSSERVTILGPGNMSLPTHQLPSSSQTGDLRPLMDRIQPVSQASRGPAPSADSLTQLLVQSVASGDGKLMEEVLRVTKQRVITSTIKKLPVHTVLPFLKKVCMYLAI
jgi:hypothetical protein